MVAVAQCRALAAALLVEEVAEAAPEERAIAFAVSFASGRAAAARVAGLVSVGATERLLRARLGVSLPRPTLGRLHRTFGRNPFYALELGRALERTGAHTGAGEGLAGPGASAGSSRRVWGLPRSILTLVDATCLHLILTDSIEHVAKALAPVRLHADRIVEAMGPQAATAIVDEESYADGMKKLVALAASLGTVARIGAAKSPEESMGRLERTVSMSA
jgi:hypothetical protein